MSVQRCLVIYDTSSDSRRRRLSQMLLRAGERVQWSVFEVSLTPAKYRLLIASIQHLVEDDDRVMIIPMSDDLIARSWRWGQDVSAGVGDPRIL